MQLYAILEIKICQEIVHCQNCIIKKNQPIKVGDILETQHNCSGNSNHGRVLRILFSINKIP